MNNTNLLFLLIIICLIMYVIFNNMPIGMSIDEIREALIKKGLPTPAFANKKELKYILDNYK